MLVPLFETQPPARGTARGEYTLPNVKYHELKSGQENDDERRTDRPHEGMTAALPTACKGRHTWYTGTRLAHYARLVFLARWVFLARDTTAGCDLYGSRRLPQTARQQRPNRRRRRITVWCSIRRSAMERGGDANSLSDLSISLCLMRTRTRSVCRSRPWPVGQYEYG